MTRKKLLTTFLVLLLMVSAIGAHYLLDPWGFYWKVPEPEAAARMQLIRDAEEWLDANELDQTHRAIIDLYNSHVPLAQSYTVQYTDSWCAAFVSAAAISCNLTDIIPTECSCERQIGLFKALGQWEEHDRAIPLPGDIIYYDWDETKPGDATGWSDHVGIVVGTKWPFVKVIEGNYDDCVQYRIVPLWDLRIRGYGKPDYAAKTP